MIRYSARGQGSGAEVTGLCFYVGHWRDGKVTGGEVCAERGQAPKAAGLGK